MQHAADNHHGARRRHHEKDDKTQFKTIFFSSYTRRLILYIILYHYYYTDVVGKRDAIESFELNDTVNRTRLSLIFLMKISVHHYAHDVLLYYNQ